MRARSPRGGEREGAVVGVGGVERRRRPGSGASRPEGRAAIRRVVGRVLADQRADLRVKVGGEAAKGPADARRGVGGAADRRLVDGGDGGGDGGGVVSLQVAKVVVAFEPRVDGGGRLRKFALEEVARPLQRVLYPVRERLQRAHRRRLLWRVRRRTVRLREVWHDDLHVALRPRRAALEQRQPVPHALAIDVQPSLDIVQRVAHNVQPAPERLVERPAVAADPLLVRGDAEARVDALARGGGARRLGLADVVGTEEELAVEVRPLDRVHVRHHHLAAVAGADAHQRQTLEELAADCAGADDEGTLAGEARAQRIAEHRTLAVEAVAARRRTRRRRAAAPAARRQSRRTAAGAAA